MCWRNRESAWISTRKTNAYPSVSILFVICTLLALLGFTRSYYRNLAAGIHTALFANLLDWLACFYPWLALVPAVFVLEQRFPLKGRKFPKHLAALVLGGVVAAAAAILLRLFLLGFAARFLNQGSQAGEQATAPLFPEYGAQLFLYFLAVLAAYILRNFTEKNTQEQKASRLTLEKLQLETRLREAELETLRMRLSPHFLFNALQSVSVLAEHDPPAASEMLARLGDLLRAAFRTEFQAEVTLETELGLTKSYLDVECVRFGNRLSVSIDVGAGTERALVPALILQPLVENAIVHGLKSIYSGAVRVQSAVQDSQLLLAVRDNGEGLEVESAENLTFGIGLSSTSERLKLLYPATHRFEVRKLEEGGTEVRIIVPLRLEQAARQDNNHEQPAIANR